MITYDYVSILVKCILSIHDFEQVFLRHFHNVNCVDLILTDIIEFVLVLIDQ